MDDGHLHDLAIGWVDAFNRRDTEALVARADPGIVVRPTVLGRDRRVYHGHDGVRAWLAELTRVNAEQMVEVATVRVGPGGGLLVFGRLLIGDEPISPFAMLMRVSGRLVVEAVAYLSDEALLQNLDRLDP